MADLRPVYVASSPVTITLASLPTSATLVAGRESNVIDNSSGLYLDFFLAGRIMTGTTPTVGVIEVNVVAMQDDTTWPDVFDGTDSAETVTTVDIKNAICRLAASMVNTATSNVAYPFGPVSVAGLFGPTMICPRKFVVFVTHSTVVALNATGTNHVLSITPVYMTSV
jgi:hypothetical protein